MSYQACERWSVQMRNGERQGVTAFFPDREQPIRQATKDSHDHFDAIMEGLENSDPDVYELFDPEAVLQKEFSMVSDRVSVKGGKIFFDLVETHDVMAEHMQRIMKEKAEGWETALKAMALFMERVAANPSEHSREHLFRWLVAEQFTINSEGKIVGYKGVALAKNDEGENKYFSTRSGPAVVNGKPINGYVPNEPGSIIQMPRDQVTFDPTNTCASGLHVGTWGYAYAFSDAVLEVEVDPADVVSVPSDSNGQKMRVWRYKVIQQVGEKYDGPVKPLEDYYEAPVNHASYDPWDDEDEDDDF